MLRTVAEDTPRPAAVARNDDATGSPVVMYSRMSAARTRLARSLGSISTLGQGLLKHYTPEALKTGTAAVTAPSNSCASSELCGRRSRGLANLGAVEVDGREVIDQDLAVDDRRPDVGAAGGV